MWVSIQQVSKMYAKPERTLRHYAAQGKIIVRKKNRSWECNLASVEKLGWVRTEYLGSTGNVSSESKTNENPNHNANSTASPESNDSKAAPDEVKVPRKFVLSNLGIYTELLALTIKIKNDINSNNDARVLYENAFKSIQSIGYGFYTFDKTSKVQILVRLEII